MADFSNCIQSDAQLTDDFIENGFLKIFWDVWLWLLTFFRVSFPHCCFFISLVFALAVSHDSQRNQRFTIVLIKSDFYVSWLPANRKSLLYRVNNDIEKME